jgi:hypothetical protein
MLLLKMIFSLDGLELADFYSQHNLITSSMTIMFLDDLLVHIFRAGWVDWFA